MAKKTCETPKMKDMFPLRRENRNEKRRHTNKYKVNMANTSRFKTSSIPYMQNILNEQDKKNRKLLNVCG